MSLFLDNFERGMLREGNPDALRRMAIANQEVSRVSYARAREMADMPKLRVVSPNIQRAAASLARKARLFSGVEAL